MSRSKNEVGCLGLQAHSDLCGKTVCSLFPLKNDPKRMGFHQFVLIAILFSASCQSATNAIMVKEIEVYPYIANAKQVAKVKDGYRQVTIGMHPAEVVAIMGEPDEIRPLYEPNITREKVIGYTHWYVLRRLVKSGSYNKRNESVVRISYDLNNQVMAVDQWGVEHSSDGLSGGEEE